MLSNDSIDSRHFMPAIDLLKTVFETSEGLREKIDDGRLSPFFDGIDMEMAAILVRNVGVVCPILHEEAVEKTAEIFDAVAKLMEMIGEVKAVPTYEAQQYMSELLWTAEEFVLDFADDLKSLIFLGLAKVEGL